MAEFTTVEDVRAFFEGLPDALKNALVSAIESTAPELHLSAFSSRVARAAGLENAPVASMLKFISGWISLIHEDRRFYFDRIINIYSGLDVDATEFGDRLELRELWRRLFSSSTFGVSVLALDIFNRRTNTFEAGHSLTEIRPIFHQSNERPQHAVIVHQLKLNYKTINGQNSMTVSLNRSHVHDLLNELNRALEREQTLLANPPYNILTD